MRTNLLSYVSFRVDKRPLLWHTLGWMLYICYEHIVVYYATGATLQLQTLYFYGCNIGLFYLHLQVLDASFANGQKKFLLCFLLFLAEILLIQTLKFAGEYFVAGLPLNATQGILYFKEHMVLNLYRTFNFVGLATLFWSASYYAVYQRMIAEAKVKELEMERDSIALTARLADTQNAFLQQQLNPHLLFNTLNFVYSSVLPHSEKASQSILLLAELIRYSLDGAGADGLVSLADEVIQMKNLLLINSYRYADSLNIHLDTEGDFRPWRIIPLALLTLTENVFKHGLVRSPKHPVVIRLHVNQKGCLTYHSKNYLKQKHTFSRNSGVGMRNLIKRLEYSYPQRHELVIEVNSEQYEVNLCIHL